jgi:hypothetical protein
MEERERCYSFILSQTPHETTRVSGVSAINPLVAYYDIYGRKGEVLFFYFVCNFDQQYNRYRVSVSKTEEQIKAHFKGLVAYFEINLNLKRQSFVFFCCQIQRKLRFMFCNQDLN